MSRVEERGIIRERSVEHDEEVAPRVSFAKTNGWEVVAVGDCFLQRLPW